MVEKKKKNSTKKGLIYPLTNKPLTKTEREIFYLYKIEGLNIKQIAKKRNVSDKSVYKVRSRLRKKGIFSNFSKVENFQCTSDRKFRLHAQEFNIKIISKNKKYEETLKRTNLLEIEENIIRLYKNSLEIYSKKSFFGNDEQESDSESQKYWYSFFIRLENEFDIIILKPRKQNIKIVKEHFSETNSEIAKEYIKRKNKFMIPSKEDGKFWFSIDDSFGLKERECLHPKTAKEDSQKVSKQLQDWRNYDPPTNSELSNAIMLVTKNQIKIQESDLEYRENIKTHIKSIQDLGEGVKKLVEIVAKLDK